MLGTIFLIYVVTQCMSTAFGLTVIDRVQTVIKARLHEKGYILKNKNSLYNFNDSLIAFAKGFIHEVKHALTADEIDSLVQASFSITIELASRFLDDYLNGDTYFKCNYPAHNLVRTRCQLQLAKDMMRKKDELQWIIRDIMAQK